MLQRTEDETLDVTLGDHDATRRLVIVLQKVLYKIRSDATVQQYALTRIDDILSGKYDRAPSRPEVLGAAELAQVSNVIPGGIRNEVICIQHVFINFSFFLFRTARVAISGQPGTHQYRCVHEYSLYARSRLLLQERGEHVTGASVGSFIGTYGGAFHRLVV